MSAIAKVFALDLVAKVILAITGVALIRLMPGEEYAHYTFAVALIVMASEALVGSWRSVYVAGGRRFGSASNAGVFLAAQLLIVGAAVLATLPFIQAAGGLYWMIVAVMCGRALLELARGSFQRALKFSSYAGVELARAALLCVSILVIAMVMNSGIQAWQALSLEAAGLVALGSYLLGRQRGFLGALRIREAAALLRDVAVSKYRYLGAYLIVLALFGQVDVFMLRSLGGDLSLATYGSSLRYYALLSMALAAVHAVFLPVAQRIETVADLNRLLSSHKKLVIGFAAVAVSAIVVADPVDTLD